MTVDSEVFRLAIYTLPRSRQVSTYFSDKDKGIVIAGCCTCRSQTFSDRPDVLQVSNFIQFKGDRPKPKISETGFLPKSPTLTKDSRKKPGFSPPARPGIGQKSKKPGFPQFLGGVTIFKGKNPVSDRT